MTYKLKGIITMPLLKHIAALALIALAAAQVTVQASEADRNRQINAECRSIASSFNDGNGQTTALCQNALYQSCLAEQLCGFYPEKCAELKRRVSVSCEPIRGLGADCRACN
jgi:hypothetical protein